jgi:hypothetical protein
MRKIKESLDRFPNDWNLLTYLFNILETYNINYDEFTNHFKGCYAHLAPRKGRKPGGKNRYA